MSYKVGIEFGYPDFNKMYHYRNGGALFIADVLREGWFVCINHDVKPCVISSTTEELFELNDLVENISATEILNSFQGCNIPDENQTRIKIKNYWKNEELSNLNFKDNTSSLNDETSDDDLPF